MKIPKKMIQEARRLVRIKLFLNEIGIGKHLNSVEDLKQVGGIIKNIVKKA